VNTDAENVIGAFAAWASGLLYFCSRFPQALLTHRSQSTKGLSLFLFAVSVVANVFYGVSILLPTNAQLAGDSLWRFTAPYLLGSIGTFPISVFILYQFYAFRGREPIVASQCNEPADNGDTDTGGADDTGAADYVNFDRAINDATGGVYTTAL
jgi:uncharacterized protein with PQ loop repeat